MYGAYAVNWQKIPNSLCGCTFRSINVGTSSCSDRSKKTSLKGNDLEGKESQALSSIADSESKVNSIYQKKQKQIEVWVCGILVIFGLILLCYSSSHSFKNSLVWIVEYKEQDDQFALHIWYMQEQKNFEILEKTWIMHCSYVNLECIYVFKVLQYPNSNHYVIVWENRWCDYIFLEANAHHADNMVCFKLKNRVYWELRK